MEVHCHCSGNSSAGVVDRDIRLRPSTPTSTPIRLDNQGTIDGHRKVESNRRWLHNQEGLVSPRDTVQTQRPKCEQSCPYWQKQAMGEHGAVDFIVVTGQDMATGLSF